MNAARQTINDTLIHHFLENSARLYPWKIAVIHEDTRATYREINSQANQVSHWLLENNIQKNNRVMLLLENSLAYVVSYYGILKSGAVAVPLSTDIKPDSLKYLLYEIEPDVIISSARF